MQEIIIATNNVNKVKEYQELFALFNINVKSLLDFDFIGEIDETGTTFEENSLIKAQYLSEFLKVPVLADDSGLEIIGLNNFPGIYTKRWAAPILDNKIVNNLLLEKCKDLTDRSARSVCALSYVDSQHNIAKTFLGVTNGEIVLEPRGEASFGFDSIFLLPELNKTYSELSLHEKNQYSHRSKAIKLFMDWYTQAGEHHANN
ncbi:RdgB/HAM1 family non-canonical purine NTP pyrophosphatase [Spiroplasma sp. DGKH1]|uniref:RdgB/HAM1 family non-canonical purine NTP pyrophosphatase n=1 Tax=Spiroplasma sp. DGKH1 TaxID=3050074 RepID=UPI0034C69F69